MDSDSGNLDIRTMLVAVALGGLLFAGGAILPNAFAEHQPANKAAVSGGTIEILSTSVTEGATSETVELLSTTLKSTSQADGVISVTLECALWTDLVIVGNDNPSSAVASVKVWVEIDGEVVPISSDDTNETGKVVFCNRAYGMNMLSFDDNEEDQEIQTFLNTRSANGFNWFALNIGSGTHDIVVKAVLEAEVDGQGTAQAGIGKRTLVFEPIKLANDVTY